MTPVNIPVPKPVIKISDESIQTSLSQKIFFSLSGKIALGTGLTSQRKSTEIFHFNLHTKLKNGAPTARIRKVRAKGGSAWSAGSLKP